MKIINSPQDFYNEINISYGLYNCIIDIDKILLESLTKNLIFENCKFKTKFIHLYNIKNKALSITFRGCSFEGRLEISNSLFYNLSFENIHVLENLYIHGGYASEVKINHFSFKNEFKRAESPLKAKIEISNSVFESFDFFNVNHTGDFFKFHNNQIGSKDFNSSILRQCFDNSWICNANFSNNIFNEKTSFFRTIFTQDQERWDTPYYNGTVFFKNTFHDVNFENTNFYKNCQFDKCNFNEKAVFRNINNYSIGDLSFYECNFHGRVDFEDARAKELAFSFCQFECTASFLYSIVETFILERNIFNKAVYFDDLQILSINNCSRKSFRTIKQELQKSENRIDYNRFRSYELAAYYNELKWYGDFKDKFILWATKWSTGFEHSWRRALVFTLLSCLLFYSLFFISENYMYSFDINYIREYLSGYFRFLIVTDFYNPLSNGREYIHATNTTGWFIFIFGKIVIAFGIYEMIQAFRKFKA